MSKGGIPRLDKVRQELDDLVPQVVQEFIQLYRRQPDRDFCSHPEKVVALVEQSPTFKKRFELTKFVAMDKECRGVKENEIRCIPRELDVVKQYRDEAEDRNFCWKIGATIGKYSILKATAYQIARRVLGLIEPKGFNYSFSLKEYNNFFKGKEFD